MVDSGTGDTLRPGAPVTIGSVIANTLLVGVVYWFVYQRPRPEA